MENESPDGPAPDRYLPEQEMLAVARPDRSTASRTPARLIWGGISIAFLAVLGFGSIDTWHYFMSPFPIVERATFVHIWSFQVERLPSVGSELLVQVMFTGAIIVFLAAVIAGLWLLIVLEQPHESHDGI